MISYDKVYLAFIFSGILINCLNVFLAVQAALSLQWKDEGKAGASVPTAECPGSFKQIPTFLSLFLLRDPWDAYSPLSHLLWVRFISVFAALQGVNFKVSSTVLLMKI